MNIGERFPFDLTNSSFSPMYKGMYVEDHPYGMYFHKDTQVLLIGTFPAWEFSSGDPSDFDPEIMIDFSYGRIKGRGHNFLWKLLGDIFNVKVDSASSIKKLLKTNKIGVASVCKSIVRKVPRNSSDQNLDVREWNFDLIDLLNNEPTITTLIFTSQSASIWFKKHFQEKLKRDDLILVIDLPSPSQAANRAIGMREDYKSQGFKDTYEYRLKMYQEVFKRRKIK